MIDLLAPLQAAIAAALVDRVDAAEVFDAVPQDFVGSFFQLGAIEQQNVGSKAEQRERFEVEVHSIHRGTDRAGLLAMMHQVRLALDEQDLPDRDGASFQELAFLSAAASEAAEDGRTFAGISLFEVYAEPA